MSQNVNRYRSNLRELRFVLFEQLPFLEVLGKGPYAAWDRDSIDMVLTEVDKFARDVVGPTHAAGDRKGCRVEDGQVKVPEEFHAAYDALYEAGWKSLCVPEEWGGQGAPYVMHAIVEEFLSGANVSFGMYPGLTYGAAEVIAHFGTPEQKKKYLTNMFGGKWGGTMCLTEPHAGSDVGAAKSSAKKLPDGTYAIKGTKIFISGGDHDLAENIVHLVLARVDGAAPGTKGLSLFIVPKKRIDADGTIAGPNDVQVAGIEHKMGINGSSTCQLNFGENDGCIGELVGTTEHVGMSQMFRMMNGARIAVGIQGLGVASSAYLNALDYAKERKQGSHYTKWKDPSAPRVAIIEHPDVRRMLLDMKARVEGIRALILKLAVHIDQAAVVAGSDDRKQAYHRGQVDLFTGIVKAYSSDQAFRVCEMAIQTYGGAGYLKDHPVEQYCRDAKIFSIYEGTNHIQAMDLVGRKLGQDGGAHFMGFLQDVGNFVQAHAAHPSLGVEIQRLGKAAEVLGSAAQKMMSWQMGGKFQLIPLAANRFLEMMAEVAVSWLLLDAARISVDGAAKLADGHPDKAFYEGKKHAALYYARTALPSVHQKLEAFTTEDQTPLEIADEAF